LLVSVRSGKEERVSEFEGDCGAAKRFEWIGAVFLSWIEDCDCVGDAYDAVGEMMVRDDEVHAESPGLFCSGEGTDAGVDADDEADA
jgi:hypothetical protein